LEHQNLAWRNIKRIFLVAQEGVPEAALRHEQVLKRHQAKGSNSWDHNVPCHSSLQLIETHVLRTEID